MKLHTKAAVLASAGSLALGGLALPAQAGTVHAQTVRGSFPCKDGSGKSFSYSYARGIVTVTVYFNNHCRTSKGLVGLAQHRNKIERIGCVPVKAHKKGSHKFRVNGPDFSGLGLDKHC
ncbi:hypothetical protein [Actinomadura gamaensis]|uniref:Uncharacterized protein n=1 Tax=Actinomadura gamaensis TaxID=1763541 RepID=A0ABV9U529_9ACTN